MTLARFQSTAVDTQGNVIPAAQVTVRSQATGLTVSIFSDRNGSFPLSNPFNADSNGYFGFHVAGGLYRISISDGVDTSEITYVGIGKVQENEAIQVTSSGNIDASVLATSSTTPRTLANRFSDVVNVKDFGAVGDNTTDDYAACQAAFTYCQSTQARLHITEGSYVLSAQLVATGTFDITSDKTAALRWTSTTDAGILFNFVTSDDSLCSIELPQLFSAGVNSSFEIPGYVAGAYTYNLANRYVTAVEVRGGNRLNVSAQTIVGWQTLCW